MKISMQFYCGMLLAGLGILFTGTQLVASDSDEQILIGQISHVEGQLLRYIEEEKDWVGTVKDSPFGLDDALYSGDEGKAEIIMPNKTWFRVSENTQFQLIALNLDATTVDVASGLARFYNKSEDAVVKVTTPYGYVVAPAGTVFDLYVGDESLEVIAVRGNVDFVHDKSKSRYEVWEGASSLIADDNETALGNGMVDSQWDAQCIRISCRNPFVTIPMSLTKTVSGSASIMRAPIAICGGLLVSIRAGDPLLRGAGQSITGTTAGFPMNHSGMSHTIMDHGSMSILPATGTGCRQLPVMSRVVLDFPSVSVGIRAGSAGCTAVLPLAGYRLHRTRFTMVTVTGADEPLSFPIPQSSISTSAVTGISTK
jgi:FecR protein